MCVSFVLDTPNPNTLLHAILPFIRRRNILPLYISKASLSSASLEIVTRSSSSSGEERRGKERKGEERRGFCGGEGIKMRET